MLTSIYPTAICGKCGGTYDRDAFFRVNVSNAFDTGRQRRPNCIGCELTARSLAKEENRIIVKAITARTRHCAKLAMRHAGRPMDGDEFGETFGWSIDRMVADIERAEQSACCYCERPFADMPGGLAEITIDIVDPARKPYYKTNCRWCCSTCNSEKSHTAPELWERKLLAWKQWNVRQNAAPEERGLLF